MGNRLVLYYIFSLLGANCLTVFTLIFYLGRTSQTCLLKNCHLVRNLTLSLAPLGMSRNKFIPSNRVIYYACTSGTRSGITCNLKALSI